MDFTFNGLQVASISLVTLCVTWLKFHDYNFKILNIHKLWFYHFDNLNCIHLFLCEMLVLPELYPSFCVKCCFSQKSNRCWSCPGLKQTKRKFFHIRKKVLLRIQNFKKKILVSSIVSWLLILIVCCIFIFLPCLKKIIFSTLKFCIQQTTLYLLFLVLWWLDLF